MAKNEVITIEQAQAVIDRVAQELGLLVTPTSGFTKIMGPGNKQRIYVQKARVLGRIDCTIDLPTDDPAYVQLSAPNGSVRCHITPTLEQLERVLRMLGDSAIATQVPNKPRPFAVNKQLPRKPKAVAAPVPEEALVPIPEGGSLKDRVAVIRARAREARINMVLENADKYGEMTYDEAAALIDDKTDLRELEEQRRGQVASELSQVISETGIEVSQ